MRMAEHENVGVLADFLTSKNIWFAKKIGDKVEGMDEQIKDGITLRVCSCKIMEVVIDKSLLCEPLPKDLYGRSIAFL